MNLHTACSLVLTPALTQHGRPSLSHVDSLVQAWLARAREDTGVHSVHDTPVWEPSFDHPHPWYDRVSLGLRRYPHHWKMCIADSTPPQPAADKRRGAG